MIYKKYSIFIYNKTINGKEYLKEYIYTYLYNKSGKSQFIHEHIIYCSNYFIKKLRKATHWYIDCTFVVPPNFKQLLVIMYRDDTSGKRYPGLFGIINNKIFEGLLFKKIKNLITIEGSKDLSLLNYSVDYEKALQDAVKKNFPKQRAFGCFYHYCKNLYLNANKLSLLNEPNTKDTLALLNQLYEIPFIFQDKSINYIKNIFQIYKDENNTYKEYEEYYFGFWEDFIKQGILNYKYLKKEQRCNSYLENYNGRIKLKLSSFLYGKKM